MKLLKQKAFTLVELMIVIAIIGILAAALFPSLTSYLKRSRDAARTSHMKDISTAVGAYYTDKEVYPDATGSGCVPTILITGKYMDTIPTDPVANRGGITCTANHYWYGSGTASGGTPQFVILGNFETELGGNISWSTGVSISLSWTFTANKRGQLDAANIVKKGNGSGYVLYK